MTATVAHYQSGIAAKLQRALEHRLGAEPLPWTDGVQYLACGVYGEYPRLAAFVVAHDEGHNLPTADAVFADIDETEACAIARSFGTDPNGYFYDVDTLETDVTAPTVGLPLVQALVVAWRILQRPPPPVPLRCRSWRHGLIFERINEIGDVQVKHWQACWEGGAQVRELPYDGVRAERLLDEAKERLWEDDLDAADRYCERAETEMVSGCEGIPA